MATADHSTAYITFCVGSTNANRIDARGGTKDLSAGETNHSVIDVCMWDFSPPLPPVMLFAFSYSRYR